jgi:hypothetical protein
MEAGEVFVMNCQEFWDTMPELGGADERHLMECAACAARMKRQRELSAALRAVAAGYSRLGAPARVERLLRASFRKQVALRSGTPVRHGWRPVVSWAAAAAMLTGVALITIQGGRPGANQPAAAKHVEMAVANTAADLPSDYDGFIPLPNAGKLPDTEDMNLVRVEVPRSAMIALGLEVSPERASEMVEADVMLGPDGLARAVRFVDADTL